jgi:anaerobic selenocysteine-containing dehydrogenase
MSVAVYQRIIRAADKGAKLIVVDPTGNKLTRRADLWLRVRPGSDLALALGMINVIVNEKLYDQAFVKNWTFGFDELKAYVHDFSPERVEEMTWIKAETINQAARLYAVNRPARIMTGNGIDMNVNSFPAHRAFLILRTITGNLVVPSGESKASLPILKRKSPELELWDKLPAGQLQKKVGAELKLLPIVRYVVPETIFRATIEEKPYPVRALYIQACNSLLSHSNSHYTYKALKKLDFLAVAELFMTPTAALADVVLPVSSFLEHDDINAGGILRPQQKVAQIGECRSDYEIISGLARKLGLAEYFWDTEEQCLDAILKPAGLTFAELKQRGKIPGTVPASKPVSKGFGTPSGKVEIYSSQLKQWGFDPLPVYRDAPETPLSDPELARDYPFILVSWKRRPFMHSGLRQIASLRKAHPEPVVQMHPETAVRLRVQEGDQVFIETKRGRIKQKAVFSTDLDPRVMGVDYGWWFPEKGASELYGWAESNVNVLSNNQPPYNREIGSTNLRGMLCKVYKV